MTSYSVILTHMAGFDKLVCFVKICSDAIKPQSSTPENTEATWKMQSAMEACVSVVHLA